MKNFFGISTMITVAAALLLAILLYPRLASEDDTKQRIVYWESSAIKESTKLLVEMFEKTHPQYKVQIGSATVRDSNDDPTRFLLGVAGNVPPDLVNFSRFAIVEWASHGAFHDLSEYLEQDLALPDGIRQERFIVPAWKECLYKDGVYAIPNNADTRAFYYNKDALVRAGLTYREDSAEVRSGAARVGEARPPATWEELCRKLVDTTMATVRKDGTVSVAAAGAQGVPYRAGDVAVLIPQDDSRRIFRARIKTVHEEDGSLVLDLQQELPPGLKELPEFILGACRLKVFDQDSYLVKLTRFDARTGVMKEAGFIPFFGNNWLFMYGWLNGGEFMDAKGEVCTLDDPRIVEALQFVTDMYDCLGGVEKAMVFQTSSATNMMDLFLNDRILMKIDGDWFMPIIGQLKPNMRFGACPAPIPEARKQQGHASLGWMGGWAYAIPSTAKNKQAAWELMRWLCSEEANRLAAQYDASVAKSKGQVFFPNLHPDIEFSRYLKREYIDNTEGLSSDLKNAYATFIELLPNSRYRPVTPAGQVLWNEQVRSAESAIGHVMTPEEALQYGTRRVQYKLDDILNPPQGMVINWTVLIVGYVALILCSIGMLAFWGWRRDRRDGALTGRWYEGYVAAAPWLLGFFTFGAGPIIFSLIISFSHYDVLNPARFVGLENYRQLMADPIFWVSLRNTAFMTMAVPLGLVAGLLLALLLSHNLKGIHFYRTIYYLPAIVPAVAAFILWMKILDPNIGLLNQFLRGLGITEPPNWLNSPVWAKPSIILMGLWGVGGGMVIWLAGIKNIPESLYEAAAIDGANGFQRFIHITLPMLTPYIFFNLIMGLIGVFQIFEEAYVMTGGGPQDSTLFYSYKLFNEAFRYLNMGAASAMAWFLFLIVISVTALNFWISKKWVHYN